MRQYNLKPKRVNCLQYFHVCWLFFALFLVLCPIGKAEKKNIKSDPQRSLRYTSNWLLYFYEQTPNMNYSRLIPLYSYTVHKNRLQEDFSFWPLLIGYETSKNPSSIIFPHGSVREWYCLPFATLASSNISPQEDMQTTTLLSFTLMTYFQERQLQNRYIARSWYSLPVFSYYQSESLWENDTQITKIEWGNPLFSFRDLYILKDNRIYPVYEWSIAPLALAFGKDGFEVLHHARWGKDHLFKMFSLDTFSIFEMSTTFSHYPGGKYQYFAKYEVDKDKAFQELFSNPLTFARNRLGIFSPFIVFQTSPVGDSSWQLLPFFHYASQGDKSEFNFLLLGLHFDDKGFQFQFQPKIFPLVYHDEMYNSWDILWPLFRYQKTPNIPEWHFRLRFVFDYYKRIDSKSKTHIEISGLERILFNYQSSEKNRRFEILPEGLLFGCYRSPGHQQWRVLGCGYLSTPQQEYLEILFIKIPVPN